MALGLVQSVTMTMGIPALPVLNMLLMLVRLVRLVRYADYGIVVNSKGILPVRSY